MRFLEEQSAVQSLKETTAIIVIDDEGFSKGCIIAFLRATFPDIEVVGINAEIDPENRLKMVSGRERVLVLLHCVSHAQAADLKKQAETVYRILPAASLVLVAPCDRSTSIELAAAIGATGLIPRTASLNIATAAINLVLAGGTCYPGPIHTNPMLEAQSLELLNGTIKKVRHERSDVEALAGCANAGIRLSPRELDVLVALGRGQPNKAIAHDLSLSENTVKVYISNIMRKLQVTNRTQAVIAARKMMVESEHA